MGMATTTTEDAARVVKQAAQSVEEQLRSNGGQAYLSAKAEAERLALERRDQAASYTHDIAEAFSNASSALEERGRDTAAHLIRRAAKEIDALGRRVEGQDVGNLVHEVEDFARRRPAIFLGGAFLLSFALVQFIGRSNSGHRVAAGIDPQSATTGI